MEVFGKSGQKPLKATKVTHLDHLEMTDVASVHISDTPLKIVSAVGVTFSWKIHPPLLQPLAALNVIPLDKSPPILHLPPIGASVPREHV